MNKINSVLKEALEESKPSSNEIKKIDASLKDFCGGAEKAIKSLKINAEIFVGGSFAKKTLVKKDKYDIDIFIRFDKKYREENLSELTKKILDKAKAKNVEEIHGSRDYFRINLESWFYFEVVPVLKISRPEEADNVTDLSYYHVRYINKKNKKLLDEIILAKRFCHANKVYGAESHIKGLSGYALELLVCYYGSFVKFLKALPKAKKTKDGKIIIDPGKNYRNKNQVMMDMNSSKLESPVILIDPTYKQRNALATLSNETFSRFRKAAEEFLRSPKIEDFRVRETDLGKLEREAKSKGQEFLIVEISTGRQAGAIAGSKLLKFYNFMSMDISKNFEVDGRGFDYMNEKTAICYFILKKKPRTIVRGPDKSRKSDAKRFREKHKKVFLKKGILYAEEKTDKDPKEFFKKWERKNKKIIKDMSITGIKVGINS